MKKKFAKRRAWLFGTKAFKYSIFQSYDLVTERGGTYDPIEKLLLQLSCTVDAAASAAKQRRSLAGLL